MPRSWRKLSVYSNWCEYDRLNGKNLEEGDSLEILFPDNSVEQYDISVEKYDRPYSDHGRQYTMPVRKAYIIKQVNGLDIKIYLRQDGIKVRKID